LQYYYGKNLNHYTSKGEKMRIISGKFKSRKLATLPGMAVRPTLDSTKEAIFSSLGGYLPETNVLDVFGGSGALALEAISRGAKKAYIIDKSPESIRVIKTNVQSLGVENQVNIFTGSYNTVLPKLSGLKFDVIFLDPPYAMKIIDELVGFLMANDYVAPNGCIVCEFAMGDIIRTDYEHYNIKLYKKYSSSEVLILQRME
jgi:16S rRNA (guanine966-N2)-methyltransferase